MCKSRNFSLNTKLSKVRKLLEVTIKETDGYYNFYTNTGRFIIQLESEYIKKAKIEHIRRNVQADMYEVISSLCS